jgi:hypothetical protein
MTNYEINHYQSILERSCIARASSLVINKGRNAFFVAEVEGLISTSFPKNIRDHFFVRQILHFFLSEKDIPFLQIVRNVFA